MKQIVFDAKTKNKKNRDGGGKETEVKIREKITNLKKNVDFSNNIVGIISDHKAQTALINKLYLGENFIEKKFLLSELKTKINLFFIFYYFLKFQIVRNLKMEEIIGEEF